MAATLLLLLDLVLVTWLFSARRTAAIGYLLNGLIVIYGSVLMGHFAVAARHARREEGEYRGPYLTDEQRSGPGWIGAQTPRAIYG